TDRLDEEVEPDPAALAGGVRDGEGAGQIGPAAVASPAGLRRQHVELPGGGHRAGGIDRGEDPVAARLQVAGHLAEPPAEGRGDTLAELRRAGQGHLFDGSRSCGGSCSSWRERTGATSRAAAKMAREAAEAPVIVVTHAIPWRT